eukprot:g5819.t1
MASAQIKWQPEIELASKFWGLGRLIIFERFGRIKGTRTKAVKVVAGGVARLGRLVACASSRASSSACSSCHERRSRL